jgi:hypothetical protein
MPAAPCRMASFRKRQKKKIRSGQEQKREKGKEGEEDKRTDRLVRDLYGAPGGPLSCLTGSCEERQFCKCITKKRIDLW